LQKLCLLILLVGSFIFCDFDRPSQPGTLASIDIHNSGGVILFLEDSFCTFLVLEPMDIALTL
jgi:hypothetical protein